MAKVQVTAYLTPFPATELMTPVSEANGALFNLKTLLDTVADIADLAETDASRAEASATYAAAKLRQIRNLIYIASEELGRAAAFVDASEDVVIRHTTDMWAA